MIVDPEGHLGCGGARVREEVRQGYPEIGQEECKLAHSADDLSAAVDPIGHRVRVTCGGHGSERPLGIADEIVEGAVGRGAEADGLPQVVDPDEGRSLGEVGRTVEVGERVASSPGSRRRDPDRQGKRSGEQPGAESSSPHFQGVLEGGSPVLFASRCRDHPRSGRSPAGVRAAGESSPRPAGSRALHSQEMVNCVATRLDRIGFPRVSRALIGLRSYLAAWV